MGSTTLSCLAFVLATTLIGLTQLPAPASADYPGVIELVGYSNRRARTHYIPPPDNPTLAPPPAKTQADIETVKANIEKYNKLLTLDTKNLPESQKDMLERIVERVARLKESLDIEELTGSKTEAAQSTPDATPAAAPSTVDSTEPSIIPEAETDPTLVLDETTLLHLQSSMDELAAAQAVVTAQSTHARELATTTELNGDDQTDSAGGETTENIDSTGGSSMPTGDFYYSTTVDPLTDATDTDDQFVAARSNNNIAAITAADSDPSSTLSTTVGNQRTITTSGKLTKTRATKRPLSAYTKATGGGGKRGQRPASTAALHKQTTNKQKLPAGTTQQYQQPKQPQLQQYQQQQQQLPKQPVPLYQQQPHKVSPATVSVTAAASSTVPTTASYGGNTNANDIYDTPVNTSAIIDSLNHAREEFYQQKQGANNKDKKPSATAKPTKYHYYPHNQHIYLLPECAIQQVCNAVYVRLNYTQPLCACPSRYRDPCSASLNEDDQHTTKLVGDNKKKAITLAKTCEATTEMRECRSPKDWSLLALQNTRTGKSHYLVICRCPDHFKMEGPMAHDQPTYASVPGIRVFGMMCVKPGYSVRKPSVQPPKRYQLQKPFYRPGAQSSYLNGGGGSYASNKDNFGRPTFSNTASSSNYHADDAFQSQHQANYQYLNRGESAHGGINSGNYRPETLTSINNFQTGIYGRNNERTGETPIEAAKEDENSKAAVSTSTQATETVATTQSEEANHSNASAEPVSAVDNTSSAQQSEESEKREKRSIVDEGGEWEDDTPEFPWDRVIEFQQSIVWD